MIQSKMYFGVVYGLLKPTEIHFRNGVEFGFFNFEEEFLG